MVNTLSFRSPSNMLLHALLLSLSLLALLTQATLDSNTTKTTTVTTNPTVITKPGCQSRCGNLTDIQYPFGVGLNNQCSIDPKWFGINCNTSFNPPKAYLGNSTFEIFEITETQMRISNSVASI